MDTKRESPSLLFQIFFGVFPRWVVQAVLYRGTRKWQATVPMMTVSRYVSEIPMLPFRLLQPYRLILPTLVRVLVCVRACVRAFLRARRRAIFSGMKAGTRRIKGTSILTRERRNPYGASQMHPTFPTFLTILNLKKKMRTRMTKMPAKSYPPAAVRSCPPSSSSTASG